MPKPITVLVASALMTGAAAADPLPSLNLDRAATTVSGLSSGAFMAVQLQVAFSNAIAGAGVVAGGPYNCANHAVWQALHVCMANGSGVASAERSLVSMQAHAEAGLIDPLEGISADQIYLFHGESDDTVSRLTMNALRETYRAVGVPDGNIDYQLHDEAGHGFVVEDDGLACSVSDPDYIIDCDFDQAGDILNQLYAELTEPAGDDPAALIAFDQSLYTDSARGMDETGLVYVPSDCASGEPCRLHIALHGCKQGFERIEDTYARQTGYNRWAEANDIVVLYPQAKSFGSFWLNPFSVFWTNMNGCWDWWGYSGDDYLSQEAPQMAAIARMAAALGAPLAP